MGVSHCKTVFAGSKTSNTLRETHQGASSTTGVIAIPKGILEQLQALPPRKAGCIGIQFTPGEDEAIRQFAPTKSMTKIARILGKSPASVMKRYRVLTGKPLGCYAGTKDKV